MFQKLLRMGFVKLKQGRHIIQVLKFGKGKNMEVNATYGQQGAFYINYAH
jgi:hypothetical protein